MDIATIALPIATLALGIAVVHNARKTGHLQKQLAEIQALLAGGRGAAGPASAASAPAEARDTGTPRSSQDITTQELQPTQLYFCTQDGKMVLGIKKLELQRLARFTRVAIRGSQARLGALAPLLQTAPSVLTHAGIVEGQLMEVVLNGPAAAPRGNQPLLALLRGANGKVVEQARVRNLPPLGALPASAVATGAAALAQQPYLEGIESTLAEMAKGLSELRDSQGSETKETLGHVVTFLREQVLMAVRRGHLPPALASELDNNDARLARLQDELVQLHRMLNHHTKHIRCAGEFDPDEMFKAVSEHIRTVDATRKQFVWSVQARLVTLQVQSLFATDNAALQDRRDAIAQSTVTPEMGADFDSLLQGIVEKLDGLDHTLSDDKTLAHRKAAMKVYAQNAFENTRVQLVEVLNALKVAPSREAVVQKPIRLAVRVEKGRFEAFELVPRQPEEPAPASAPRTRTIATA